MALSKLTVDNVFFLYICIIMTTLKWRTVLTERYKLFSYSFTYNINSTQGVRVRALHGFPTMIPHMKLVLASSRKRA